MNFEPDTLRAMASVDGVVAIKEASFDARRFVDTVNLIADLPRPITLLTGNDNFILESFMLGATGALIGFGAVMTREQVRDDRGLAGRPDRRGPRARRAASSGSPTSCSRSRSATTGCGSRSACGSSASSRRPTSAARCMPIDDEERAFLAEVLAEVGLLPGTPAADAAALATSTRP